MFVEKKLIGNNSYYYLRISVRDKDKVRTKTIAYLGKKKLTNKQLLKEIKKIPLHKIKEIKKMMKQSQQKKDLFLSDAQQQKLEEIREEFIKKQNDLDQKILQDMFKDFKTTYVYNTNAIEGNTITLEETNFLLNENKTPEGKDLKEVYDHINERDAFDFILKEKPEITAALIIKIHAMLLKNIDQRVGSFRQHNVRVFGASFDTTDAKYIQADMEILMRWYAENKRQLHPLALSALFHEKFERIHPFYDGNGRTGRVLINLILLRNNYPPLIIKNKDKMKYYAVLSKGHKAKLTESENLLYKDIVDYCYEQLIKTYDEIFAKWG
ncbi:Fic family protein [Candidatus Woesearchaeota archaeon]|nr:Fic family protein [Candidatus Woesearchaeota archaeon]